MGQQPYSLPLRHPHNKLDRATIAALAPHRELPSVGATRSALSVNQREEFQDAVYNHRPHFLTGPPVQIYNPAFVTFIREMSRPYEAMEFSGEELEKARKLINISLDFHRDEINLLQAFGDLYPRKVYTDIGDITLSGATGIICPAAKRQAIVRIFEVKNEIGEGGSDPIAQAECDFVTICSSEEVILSLIIVPVYVQIPFLRSTVRNISKSFMLSHTPCRDRRSAPRCFWCHLRGKIRIAATHGLYLPRATSYPSRTIRPRPFHLSGGPGSSCAGESHRRACGLLLATPVHNTSHSGAALLARSQSPPAAGSLASNQTCGSPILQSVRRGW